MSSYFINFAECHLTMASLISCKPVTGVSLLTVKPAVRISNDQFKRFYAKRVPKGLRKEPKTIGVAGTLFLVKLF